MSGDGLLLGGLEQKLAYLAGLKAYRQIVERPVSLSALAATVGLAAGGETLDERSSQQVARDLQRTKEPGPALAQRQDWLAAEVEYLSQLLGEESQIGDQCQESEFASPKGISSTASRLGLYIIFYPNLPELLLSPSAP